MNRYFLVVVAALLVAGCSFLETTSTSTTSTSVAPETEAPTTMQSSTRPFWGCTGVPIVAPKRLFSPDLLKNVGPRRKMML